MNNKKIVELRKSMERVKADPKWRHTQFETLSPEQFHAALLILTTQEKPVKFVDIMVATAFIMSRKGFRKEVENALEKIRLNTGN